MPSPPILIRCTALPYLTVSVGPKEGGKVENPTQVQQPISQKDNRHEESWRKGAGVIVKQDAVGTA